MYKTVKTQGKIVYIRCTDSTNLLKNSNSLSVKNRENQMKIEEHTKLSKLNGKLITLDVQIIQICFQI